MVPFRAAGERDWAWVPVAGQVRADLVAVHAGQFLIQNAHVVAGQGHVAEGVLPVVGNVDGHALLMQAARHRLGEPAVVLHHQYSHTLSRWAAWSVRPAQAGLTAGMPGAERPATPVDLTVAAPGEGGHGGREPGTGSAGDQ
jgi:hypothetical protein